MCVSNSPFWEKGNRIQSPSPALGEGFRVRAAKLGCTLLIFVELKYLIVCVEALQASVKASFNVPADLGIWLEKSSIPRYG
jgi:hypothetical protein